MPKFYFVYLFQFPDNTGPFIKILLHATLTQSRWYRALDILSQPMKLAISRVAPTNKSAL